MIDKPDMDREDWELQFIKAQVSLSIKQSQTVFWKVMIAAIAATAVVTGAATTLAIRLFGGS